MPRSTRSSRSPRRRAPLRVHKFGGASVADAAAIRHAASVVAGQKGDADAVVVVSALAGVTDALLGVATLAASGDGEGALAAVASLRERHLAVAKGVAAPGAARELRAAIDVAHEELAHLVRGLAILRELTPRTSDFIVARGERLSARLLAAALERAGVAARFVDATDVVRTDGLFGSASPDFEATEREARRVLAPLVAGGIVPVLPGFIGRAPDGNVTTLGRGGSDLSATLLGRVLRAAEVCLWKDVPGLLTADPRLVPEAQVIPRLDAREAAELAYYGAKVLHPRALTPLAHRATPLRVRPVADPGAPGTEIAWRRPPRSHPVRALSAIRAQALVTVTGNGMLGVPGVAARTFGAMHQAGISVSLISQASSEHSICFTVPASSAAAVRERLREAFADEIARHEIDGVEISGDVATLAVVGLGMRGTRGIAARVFSALAEAGVNIVAIAQGSSELNISAVIDGADLALAMKSVHAAFQLDRIGGGAVGEPARADIVLLGFGQIGRMLVKLARTMPHPGVALRVVGIVDRGGYLFDPRGIGPTRLARVAAAKRDGISVADLPGGARSAPRDAVAAIGRHALARPILVDVTAADTTPALSAALEGGLDVVLANKRPLAGPIPEARALRELAASRGRRVLHETTVGAGLPIIDTYYKLVESGDRVLRIDGCTSGTLGFLMTELEAGRSFSDAVRRAMERGFTEPDPREDLSGMDVARKALILGRLIGYAGELADVAVESLVPDPLRDVSRDEFLARLEELDAPWRERVDTARETGRVLRYIATVTPKRVSVGLQAVDGTSPFAGLQGTDNQVAFTTTRYRAHPLVITGPGAGPAVTAAGVLNDVLKLATS